MAHCTNFSILFVYCPYEDKNVNLSCRVHISLRVSFLFRATICVGTRFGEHVHIRVCTGVSFCCFGLAFGFLSGFVLVFVFESVFASALLFYFLLVLVLVYAYVFVLAFPFGFGFIFTLFYFALFYIISPASTKLLWKFPFIIWCHPRFCDMWLGSCTTSFGFVNAFLFALSFRPLLNFSFLCYSHLLFPVKWITLPFKPTGFRGHKKPSILPPALFYRLRHLCHSAAHIDYIPVSW